MMKNAAAVTTVIPVKGARIRLMIPSKYINPEKDMSVSPDRSRDLASHQDDYQGNDANHKQDHYDGTHNKEGQAYGFNNDFTKDSDGFIPPEKPEHYEQGPREKDRNQRYEEDLVPHATPGRGHVNVPSNRRAPMNQCTAWRLRMRPR